MKKRVLTSILSLAVLLTALFPAFSGFAKSDEPTWEDIVNAQQTLAEMIALGADAKQIDYPSDVWTQLQKEISAAKELERSAGYFAVRADVNTGHVNTGRYLSRVGSSGENGGVSSVLRYKGHGTTADEKSAFDDDQIWQVTYIDDTHTIFTLRNREGNYLRVTSTNYSDGKLIRVGALNATNKSDAYFEKHDLDDVGSCALAPVDQNSFSGYVVDFTRKTHDFADNAASRPSNIMLARPLSSVAGRNRCVFEELTELNADLESAKQSQMNTLKTLLLKKIKPLSFEERVESLSVLGDAIVLADSMVQSDFRSEDWSQLQSALLAAKEWNRNAGYFAIRADVPAEHVNTERYLSRVGSTGNSGGTSAVLRYRGHGDTADAKPDFDDDQIWQVLYTDNTNTTFTLCNLEGNYLRVSATNYGDGKFIRTGALSSNVSEAYFRLLDVDENGSGILAPVDQESFSGFVIDFTRKTHDYADDLAARPSNLMLARPESSIKVRNRCVFEEISSLNIDLQKKKAELTETIKSLLTKKLETPLSVETAITLEEALYVAQQAEEKNYSAMTWIELQEAISEAKKLVLEQGQYVIGAGVETGHHNEGRYITASGGHYDSYMTLRYRGKGESADDIATFSSDQIWIKRDVEGQQDVFTLQNLSTGLWLCIGQPIGNVGYIIAAYAEPATPERSYWIVKNDMLYAVDQEGIVDQAVDFTKTTDNVPDTQKQPRTDNYFHTRGASSMKFESKPLFYRLSNMDNTNLDNQKSETKTRLINILRRVSGSPLGNLSDLYNDILENDSSLNYSESDYAALENALKLSVATLQSKLYRIQIGKNAAWADEDGFVRFSLIDNTNLKQLWSRDTVAGSTDKELFYSFCNAVYGSYLYQSDEQNPAFQGISDFGCYVKHAKESLLGDDNDRILFSYSDEGNLLPKVNNSALAAQVSLRFKETGGDHKVFTDAGQSPEKEVRIEQIDDVETTMYIAAQCYQTLSDLRKKRIDDPETFSNEDLSALQVQAEALLKNSAVYSAGSVENLQNAVAEIQSILTAQENGEHVKISTKNLAGSVLKAAMSALQDLTNTATSSYKQRLLNAMNTLKKTMEATDDVGAKLYCEPCINAAQKQLTSADQVLADITATYQTVDKAVAALEDRNQKMVLNKNYLTLFQNLEGVRYRDMSIYQPETWEPLYAYFQEAENVYKSIQKYTNSEIVKCNTEFSGYVRALQKRATISSLEALLSMLKNLNLKQSDFTVQTWAPYIRTYNEAVALVKNADAQQGSVDTIINALVTAANALAYQDNDGSVGMFPAILTGSQKNLRDRYDEGYQLGIRWGSYEGYEKAWREGYDKTMAALKNELSSQEDDEPEAPVQEITQTVTTVTERFYQPGGLPAWLIYVLIGSGVFLFIAFGLIGFAVAKKRSNKKPPISKTIGEEELP